MKNYSPRHTKIMLAMLGSSALLTTPMSFAIDYTTTQTATAGQVKDYIGDSIMTSDVLALSVTGNGAVINLTDVNIKSTDTEQGKNPLRAGSLISDGGKLNITGGSYTRTQLADPKAKSRSIFGISTGAEVKLDNVTITSTDKHASDSGFTIPASIAQVTGVNSSLTITDSRLTTNMPSMLKVNYGASAAVSDSRLSFVSDGTLAANYKMSNGIEVDGAGSLLTGLNLMVTTDMKAVGDSIWNGALFQAIDNGHIVLENSNIISTNGVEALKAFDSAIVDARQLTIDYTSVDADGSRALRASSASQMNLTDSSVNVHGDTAKMIAFVTLDAHLTVDNSTLIADGAMTQGVQIQGINSSVVLKNNSMLQVNGPAIVLTPGQVTDAKDISVTVENSRLISNQSWAVQAQDNSRTAMTDALVNISGTGSEAKGEAGAVNLVSSYFDSNMTVNVSDSARLTGDVRALALGAGTQVAIMDLNLSNQGHWTGDVITNGANTAVNIDLTSGSVWNGKVEAANNSGSVKARIDNSVWNLTDDAQLPGLTLANNGRVNLSSAGKFNHLKLENLTGDGAFGLRTDISAKAGDLLSITGTALGTHLVTVENSGSAATNGSELLTVINTASADSLASFNLTNQVELGGYLYDLRKTDSDWELYSSGKLPEKTKPGGGGTGNGGSQLTSSANAAASFLNTVYLMNYAETQTLLQRMGELRQNDEQGNVWARGFAGRFDNFANGKLSGFTMNYHGFQIGADKKIEALNGDIYLGTMIGISNSSQKYRDGDGSLKSYSLGVYGSYLSPQGLYLDAIAKYSHMKNDFSVQDTHSKRIGGDASSDGFSASLESGKRFYLAQNQSGFYLEPQAQLSFAYQDSSSVNASNGLSVNIDSYTSTLGRASTLLGYSITEGEMPINVYVKTGYVREFSGDVDYHLNGSKEGHTNKGGWWNNGIGVNAQVGKQHTLYLDFDSSTGNKFDQRQINGGYRFSF